MQEEVIEVDKVEDVVLGLRTRANKSRSEGVVYVLAITTIAYTVVAYFVYFGSLSNTNISISGSRAPVSINAGTGNEWIPLISGAILRLGAVVLAIYVIQILMSLARYRFRISDALHLKADILLLSRGNPELTKSLMGSLSDNGIDFGPIPDNPYTDIARSALNLASKNK